MWGSRDTVLPEKWDRAELYHLGFGDNKGKGRTLQEILRCRCGKLVPKRPYGASSPAAEGGSRSLPFKIGFDSCTVPALLEMKYLDPVSIDTCEGGRWSAYISPDMRMMPCSFAHNSTDWSVSLRDHTIQEAWESSVFEDFRRRLRASCPDCKQRALCMGGCPILPRLVLCPYNKKNRTF